jgi:hypothetical protein
MFVNRRTPGNHENRVILSEAKNLALIFCSRFITDQSEILRFAQNDSAFSKQLRS